MPYILNNFLFDQDSPALKARDRIPQIFSPTTGRISPVKEVPVGEMAKFSERGTASGSSNNGEVLILTSTIRPSFATASEHAGDRIYGAPRVEIYVGTGVAAGSLVFPSVADSANNDLWRFTAGWRSMGGNEISDRYQVNIYNNSGGAGTVYAVVFWKFVQNTGGVSAGAFS